MKSILLKIDDRLFEDIEKAAKAFHTSRTNYIKKALEAYNKVILKKRLEAQLAYESNLVREDSAIYNSEFDALLLDGLEIEDDETI